MTYTEKPVKDFGIDIPDWIDDDIDTAQIEGIVMGGCASGAYMPAVTYHTALQTMNEYGDGTYGVMSYLEDVFGGDIPPYPDTPPDWSSLACHYLSLAVEAWANDVYYELEGRGAFDDSETDE